VLPQPGDQFGRVRREPLRLPVELQQREGGTVAQMAVQARLVFAAVGRRVVELDFRARQDGQRNAGRGKRVVEPIDVRQDVGAQQPSLGLYLAVQHVGHLLQNCVRDS